MKKIIYYFIYIFLLFLISIIPASAKDNKTCVRTETNLRVPDDVTNKNNLNDILITPCVDEVEKVYDFADLLTDSEEDLLYNEVSNYISNTKYDLVLVTTNENIKNSARDYADDFYDYNFFGLNETRDGVLILIDMDTRELYISTSGYAIKMYDDFRIERILDDGYNYITSKDYYNTFSSMTDSLNNYFDIGYPETNKELQVDEFGNPYYIKYIPYSTILIIASIITLIITLIFYKKSRLKIKKLETISYLKGKENIQKSDEFVNDIVTRTRRSSDSSFSSSSGSSRGGSSYHSSSSGRSHGGGGRKF